MLDQTLNLINHLPHLLQEAAPFIGGGAVASIVVQGFKHKLSLENGKVLTILLSATSFLEVAINYLHNQAVQNPTVLGTRTAAIVGASQVVYQFGTKPLYNVLLDAKQMRSQTSSALSGSTVITTSAPVTVPAVSTTTLTPSVAAPDQPTTFEG